MGFSAPACIRAAASVSIMLTLGLTPLALSAADSVCTVTDFGETDSDGLEWTVGDVQAASPDLPAHDPAFGDAISGGEWSEVSACDSCQECTGCDHCTPRHRTDQRGLLQGLLCCKQRSWIARVDALLLWRGAPQNRPLFTQFNFGTGQVGPVALNANQLVSDPLVAPRVSLFRADGCGYAREVTYIYAGNFYADRSLPPVNQGYAVAAPGIYGNPWGNQLGAPAITTVDAKLLASLQSLEFNARTPFFWDMAQFLFGFRWVQWQENLSMVEQFSDPTAPTITGTGFYDTDCINDLYGGQIGLDSLLLTTNSGMRIEGLVKAGAYYNTAVQSSSYNYTTTQPFAFQKAIRVGETPAGGAFVGEVGLTGVIPLRRNWDCRIGYFGLWLESIAQPVNQLSGQNLTQPEIVPAAGTLTTTGGVVVHGLSLGLEGRW